MQLIADLMFALAQWLKTTPLSELALWLATTPLSALIDSSIWIAPVVQTTHILSIAATFGSVLMIVLRVFRIAGLSRTLPETAARYLPWIWWGLLVLLLTGLVLILGEPARELLNPAFWTKMTLVLVAIAASLLFGGSVHRNPGALDVSGQGSLALRAGAAGVLLLWCLIIVLGRWIAYAPT